MLNLKIISSYTRQRWQKQRWRDSKCNF